MYPVSVFTGLKSDCLNIVVSIVVKILKLAIRIFRFRIRKRYVSFYLVHVNAKAIHIAKRILCLSK